MSASAGRVLIIPKGTYNSATNYHSLDAVFYNGSTYIAKGDTVGNTPTDTDHWQIMAQGSGVISGAFSGACDSLGSAQTKSVLIPPADNFALQKGVIVGVRFANTNTFNATSENPIALNVNSTGAISIYFGGTATPLGDNVVAFGEAGYTHFYQYDGSNWVFIGRSGLQTAALVPYDNTDSELAAAEVQGALDELAQSINEGTQTLTGNPLSFTTETEEIADATIVTYSPTQSGSGDPSPSNVRPFVGQDALMLSTTRKNMLDASKLSKGGITYSNGELTGTSLQFHNAFNAIGGFPFWNPGNEQITISFKAKKDGESASGNGLMFLIMYSDGTYDRVTVYRTTVTYTDFSLTSNPSKTFSYIRITYGTAGEDVWHVKDFQIELGSTATAYEPYNPLTDISISLGETLYGGTWDVEKGLLTVIHKRVDMGSLTWEKRTTGDNRQYFRVSVSDAEPSTNDLYCEIYKSTQASPQPNNSIYVGVSGTTVRFYVYDDNASYTDSSAFISAVTGKYIVYKLATPIVFHLTPHVVELLNGENIVTSNGTSISLTYRKGDIAKLSDLVGLADGINELAELSDGHKDLLTALFTAIAPTEETDTATIAHSTTSNKYFFNKDHEFCKATTSISVGATLTKNTNYSVTSIGAELLSLS